MGTVYRQTVTQPLPAGAEIFTRQGRTLRTVEGHETARPGRHRLTTGRTGQTGSWSSLARSPPSTGTGPALSAPPRPAAGTKPPLAGCWGNSSAAPNWSRLAVMTAGEDSVADHQGTPLAGHLDAYLLRLEAEGTSPAHRVNVRRCLDRLAADCGFAKLADLQRERLERWLVSQSQAGMGARTRNTYRAAAVAFGNWCVRNQRLTSNPFAATPKANEAADTRKQRRSLTEDELHRLLYVARLRPLAEYGRATVHRDGDDLPQGKRSRRTWHRAPLTLDNIAEAADRARDRLQDNPVFLAELVERGRERALLYKTAVLTGLRRGELASLIVASLNLDADPPFLTLDAADEKSREGNTLPLRADLAAELREWLADRAAALQDAARQAPTVRLDSEAVQAGKRGRRDSTRRQGQACQGMTTLPPDTPVFCIPKQMYCRLDVDLQAAGIPKTDERGWTVDFHALRHTFGTLLSATGTAPRTAQAAMRHSDIGLTMNTYTDPRLLDVSGAIDRLPDLPLDGSLPLVEKKAEVATGTDGKPDSPATSRVTPMVAPTADVLSVSRSFPDNPTADRRRRKKRENHRENRCFPDGRASFLESWPSSLMPARLMSSKRSEGLVNRMPF